MPAVQLGNLAQSMVARHAQTRIQSDLTRLSMELTTGLTQNVAKATGGDTRTLTALTRQIDELEAYATARAEAKMLAESSQVALSTIQTRIGHLRESVVTVTQSQDPAQHDLVSKQARNSFISMLGDLNIQSAGRSVFAGTAQDQPAMRAAEDVLLSIEAAVAGVTTASDLSDALDAYFAPGGPFEVNDYLGSSVDSEAIRVGPTEHVSPTVRADNPALRNALKTLATLAELPALPLSEIEAQTVVNTALDDLTQGERSIIEIRSRIGSAEANIDIASSNSAGAKAAYQSAQLDALAIDPFATAARLEETQTQLQTLYTITARLSGLNLVNFL